MGGDVLGRFGAPARHPAFWVSLWAATVAAELVVLVSIALADEPVPGYRAIFRLIGGLFAACGLIAWRRRPGQPQRPAHGPDRVRSPHRAAVRAAAAVAAADRGRAVRGRLGHPCPRRCCSRSSPAAGSIPDRSAPRRRVRPPARRSSSSGTCSSSATATSCSSTRTPGSPMRSSSRPGCSSPSPSSPSPIVIGARWKRASAPRRRALLPSVAGLACLLFFAVVQQAAPTRAGGVARGLLARSPSRSRSSPGLLRSRLARGGLAELFRDAADDARRRRSRPRSRRRSATRTLVARLPAARPRRATSTRTARPVALPRPATTRRRADRARRPRVAALVYDAVARRRPRARRGGRAPRPAIALENEHLHAESRGAARRAARVARADRRGRRRRAPAARARPARRRAAAARRASRCSCGCSQGRHPRATRRPPSSSRRRRATSSPSRSRSCASSRAASIPPCSTTGSTPRSTSLAARSPVPTAVSCERAASALPGRSSSPRTSSPARRWRTSPSTREATSRVGPRVARPAAGVGDRDRRRRRRRRGRGARLGPARPRRPRRGARRPLRVASPPGAGTVVIAELPCGS